MPTALRSTTKQPSSSSIAATPKPTSTPKPSATPKPTKEQSDTESASGGNELRIEQSRDLMKHVNKYRSDAGVSALSWNSNLGSDAESFARSWAGEGNAVVFCTNIARQCNGAKSASKAVSDWMEGNAYVPSYSATLLSSQYTQIGGAMCYLPEGNEYGYHYFWCILLM